MHTIHKKRGALIRRAENIPIESEPGNAGVENFLIINEMKKLFMTIAAFAAISSATSFAQEYANDSLTNVHLHEVQIVSTRATAKTPIAFTNVSKEELQKQNTGLDLPFLLLNTPSVITTSDAGAGIGYTDRKSVV